jgi:hypothetical protein
VTNLAQIQYSGELLDVSFQQLEKISKNAEFTICLTHLNMEKLQAAHETQSKNHLIYHRNIALVETQSFDI